MRQGDGIGFKPYAWAKLRDADFARALERELGNSARYISQGLCEGVVIGSITTSLGKQTVIGTGLERQVEFSATAVAILPHFYRSRLRSDLLNA